MLHDIGDADRSPDALVLRVWFSLAGDLPVLAVYCRSMILAHPRMPNIIRTRRMRINVIVWRLSSHLPLSHVYMTQPSRYTLGHPLD